MDSIQLDDRLYASWFQEESMADNLLMWEDDKERTPALADFALLRSVVDVIWPS